MARWAEKDGVRPQQEAKAAPVFDPTRPYAKVGKGSWEGYEQNGALFETNGKPKE